MGVACPLPSIMAVHSSLPVRESNARNRRSFVAPMKTRPDAVAMDPPMFNAPVPCTPRASSSSTTPSGVRHAISPVLTFTAVNRPHGGFWQGYRFGSQNRPYSPKGLVLRHATPASGGCLTICPIAPTSFVFTNTYPSFGSEETPDQVAPPNVPGNTTVDSVP